MASIYDVDPTELIEKAAKELEKNENMKAPEWASYVKTGAHKERVPLKNDWWPIRAAAVLRTVYRYGPIGVSKLRVKYGGKKRRGHKPNRFYPGSGSIIRKVLQQLEKAGLLKQQEKSGHKGRVITPQGKSFLDKIATQIYKGSSYAKKAEAKPKVEVKKEVKPKADVKKEEKAAEPKKEEKAKVEKKEVKAEAKPKADVKKEEKAAEPKKEEKAKVEKKEVKAEAKPKADVKKEEKAAEPKKEEKAKVEKKEVKAEEKPKVEVKKGEKVKEAPKEK